MSKELPVSNKEDWLSLKQAADRLGVHPTTLRRWADGGEIHFMLTPGGHRRFAISDIDRFSEEHRRLRMVAGLEQIWAEKALSQARQEIVRHKDEHWLAIFSEEDRERKRLLGRRLMGLIFQYISLNEGGGDILEEARAIGREHAENTLSLGLPLVEAIQAMLFFRDTMVEVAIQLPEVAHVRPEANTRLLRRINALLNTVQLAIAETYDRASK
jgi:excisionase family DNA binding protein